MKKPDLEYYKILHHFTLGVDVLFVFLLLFNYLKFLPEFWSLNFSYVFFGVVALNTILFAFKVNKIPEAVSHRDDPTLGVGPRDKSSMIYYFSHLFLLSLVVIVLNQFLKRQFIIDFMPELTALSIALGFLTFYAHRNRVEKEIEDEKVSEEKAEKKRFEEFGDRFPKLNKVWGLRRFVRWMYKEGWWYSVGFIFSLLLFVLVKLYFIFHNPVLVSDDVQAIFIGQGILDNGGFLSITDSTIPYLRGSYLSVLASIFFYFFGQSIYVAKSIPAFLGLISFVLFYFVSRKLIKNKKVLLLTLFAFIFHPLIIFNHWFIRFYVFYEIFFLSSLLISFYLLDSLRNNKKYKSLCLSSLLMILTLIVWFLSYDTGKNLIILAVVLEVLFILMYKFKPNKQKIIYLSSILVFFIFLYLFGPLRNIINFFFNGTLKNSNHLDLFVVLFQRNWILSISLIIGIISLFIIRDEKRKLFYFVVGSLFLLHLVSSEDLQMSRGILYLIPSLVLSLGMTISFFQKIFKKYPFIIITFFIVFLSYLFMFPGGYINNHPYLEEELHYQDDLRLYNFININLPDYTIIQSNYEVLQETFFDVKTEYIFITNEEYLKKAEYFYYDASSEHYRQISTETPIIKDKKIFFKDIRERKIVLILAQHVYEGYLDDEAINEIKKMLPNSKEFEGYIIYYN